MNVMVEGTVKRRTRRWFFLTEWKRTQMFADRVSTNLRGGFYILPGNLTLTLDPQKDGVHATIKRGRQPVLGTILGGKVQGIPFRLQPNADTVLEGSIYIS